jgi:hypothetical protein
MKLPHLVEVSVQIGSDTVGQNRHTILPALTLPDRDLTSIHVYILHPKFKRLAQAKAASVQESSNEPCASSEMRQDRGHLRAR